MSQVLSHPDSETAKLKPLCVDLDGTLVKSGHAGRLPAGNGTNPAAGLPAASRIAFSTAKQHLRLSSLRTSNSGCSKKTHLPYNRKLIQFLQQEHASGPPWLYLATGANLALAERVAKHLGIFNGVLGSDGSTNLTGSKKLATLQNRFGQDGFAYVGNGSVDLPLLSSAAERMLANPTLSRAKFSFANVGISPSTGLQRAGQPPAVL